MGQQPDKGTDLKSARGNVNLTHSPDQLNLTGRNTDFLFGFPQSRLLQVLIGVFILPPREGDLGRMYPESELRRIKSSRATPSDPG